MRGSGLCLIWPCSAAVFLASAARWRIAWYELFAGALVVAPGAGPLGLGCRGCDDAAGLAVVLDIVIVVPFDFRFGVEALAFRIGREAASGLEPDSGACDLGASNGLDASVRAIFAGGPERGEGSAFRFGGGCTLAVERASFEVLPFDVDLVTESCGLSEDDGAVPLPPIVDNTEFRNCEVVRLNQRLGTRPVLTLIAMERRPSTMWWIEAI